MQQHILTTGTVSFQQTVASSSPPLRWAAPRSVRDGTKCAHSLRASTIAMFCRSVTEEALVPTDVDCTPVYLMQSQPTDWQLGPRNVTSLWRKSLFEYDGPPDSWMSSTNKDSLERFSVSLNWVSLLIWMVLFTRMQYAHATMSVDVAALSVQVRLQ